MEKTHSIKNYWRYFVYLISGLLLIAPISITYLPTDEINGEWQKNYVWNSFEYFIFIIPILLLLFQIPRFRNQTIKKVSILLLCLLSGIASFSAFLHILLPIQDFIPEWGILLFLILFPIAIIEGLMEWKRDTLD